MEAKILSYRANGIGASNQNAQMVNPNELNDVSFFQFEDHNNGPFQLNRNPLLMNQDQSFSSAQLANEAVAKIELKINQAKEATSDPELQEALLNSALESCESTIQLLRSMGADDRGARLSLARLHGLKSQILKGLVSLGAESGANLESSAFAKAFQPQGLSAQSADGTSNVSSQKLNPFGAARPADATDSFGQQIAQSNRELLGMAKSLVYEKMDLANQMVTKYQDPAAQVRLLLSAFDDSEWFIGTVLADFDGVELPADAKETIAVMRALQGQIINQLRSATGLNLSDDEFRALLERAPGETQQGISVNELVRRDKNMKPGPDANTKFEAAIQNDKKNYMDKDSLYGIQSNPEKFQKSLASAQQKMTGSLEAIIQQAKALIQRAEREPSGNSESLETALALLKQGVNITKMGKKLEGNSALSSGENPYAGAKATLDQLVKRAVKLLEKQGVSLGDLKMDDLKSDLKAA